MKPEPTIFKPTDWAIFDVGMYNPMIFAIYGLGESTAVEIKKVRPMPAKTCGFACHPQMVTIGLPDGSEHEFSGAFFQHAPGSREC